MNVLLGELRKLIYVPYVLYAACSYSANTATLTIQATVEAVCSLSLDTTSLDLGTVDSATLSDLSADDEISGMTGTVNVTSSCTGTTSANMTISTTNDVSTSGYLMPTGDIIRFGLKIYSDNAWTNQAFDSSSKTISRTISSSELSSGYTESFQFYALKGSSSSVTAGTYSGTVTIELQPE